MPSAESVTIWIQQLKEGERAVVQKLWEAYFSRLVRQAQGWLRRTPVKVAEAEDIPLSAFKSCGRCASPVRTPWWNDCYIWRWRRVRKRWCCTPHGSVSRAARTTAKVVDMFCHQTETDDRRSVVRISASQRYPNLLKPWMKDNPHEVTGTGVVIDGQRILTNAHLVTYAKQIYVEPYHSSDKLAATVERLPPGIDLALLKVEDATFWINRPPLPEAAGLPEGKDAVSVYGYPVGAASLALFQRAYAKSALR